MVNFLLLQAELRKWAYLLAAWTLIGVISHAVDGYLLLEVERLEMEWEMFNIDFPEVQRDDDA